MGDLGTIDAYGDIMVFALEDLCGRKSSAYGVLFLSEHEDTVFIDRMPLRDRFGVGKVSIEIKLGCPCGTVP